MPKKDEREIACAFHSQNFDFHSLQDVLSNCNSFPYSTFHDFNPSQMSETKNFLIIHD